MYKRGRHYFILFLALSFFVLTACGKKAVVEGVGVPENPYKGTAEADTVTVDIQMEPPELNSILSTDNLSGTILRMSLSGLFRLDENDVPQPELVEAWEQDEEYRSYTLHLRKDAVWSNGEPVTAHDFIFAWKKIMDPATASPAAYNLYDNIKNGSLFFAGKVPVEDLGIRAIDDYTIQVEFEKPTPNATALFASTPYFPMNQKAYEEIGEDTYARDADKIITNGAYMIKEWVHDDHILLEKNPDYFRSDSIRVPKVKYVMINDANARMNAFKTGQVDVIDLIGEQIPQMDAESSAITQEYYDNAVFYLQFNTAKGAVSNANIRKALGLSIDIKSLCENSFKDGSIEANGYVPPRIMGADDKTFAQPRERTYPCYDVDAAKKYLEEGLKELNMDKSQLKLTYMGEDSAIGRLQGEYFQQQWAANLGLDVEIDLLSFKSYVDALQNGNFDFSFVGSIAENNPLSYLQNYRSDNENNYGSFQNPEYDTYLLQAEQSADAQERQRLAYKAEELLLDEAAVMPLYYTRIVYAVSSKVTGITCTSLQKYNFTNGAEIIQ